MKVNKHFPNWQIYQKKCYLQLSQQILSNSITNFFVRLIMGFFTMSREPFFCLPGEDKGLPDGPNQESSNSIGMSSWLPKVVANGMNRLTAGAVAIAQYAEALSAATLLEVTRSPK